MDKDLQKKLEQWEKNKPVNRQLEELQKIAEDMSKVVKQLSYISTKSEKGVGDVGTLLMDIRESLEDLSNKEDPETPDYAEPVVKTLVKLEKSLTKALSGLDLSPNISVNAPDVKVDSNVDLTGVEKILKNDLPKAFNKAVGSIPKVDIPKNDYTPLVKQLKELSEKLDSIDTGVRLKPLPPSSIEVSNLADIAGDATAANQDEQTALLTTIDADTGSLASTVVGGQLQVDLASVSTTLYVEQPTGSALQTTEANSAAIKTAVETIDNAIAGNEMQVDVVGALPAGTNAIGKLAANSGVDIGDVDVTSSVTSSLDHGSNLDIDTTAEQITSTSFACKFGVTVKADITNTGIIYVGNSDVTAGSTAATDGFPLSAGETLTLEVNNPNLLYAIASANNQKIYWVAN